MDVLKTNAGDFVNARRRTETNNFFPFNVNPGSQVSDYKLLCTCVQGRSQLFLTKGAKRGKDIFQGGQDPQKVVARRTIHFFLYKFCQKVDSLKICAAKSDKQKKKDFNKQT